MLVLVALGAILASCGGSSDSNQVAAPMAQSTATQAAAPKSPFGGVVAVSELVVGENRFSLGIIDNASGQPVPDAQVHFRFFTVQGNQGTPKSEAEGRFIAPARDAGVSGIIEHKHPDGTTHPHANVEADVGVYVARVTFDQPGNWGVEAAFRTKEGQEGKVTLPFTVLAQSTTPAVGTPAPRTKNPTAKDVTNLSQIDSAVEPVAALHQISVADAIAAGKPALVAFITPGYCATRFCGPTYELVKKLIPTYGDKAALIHIEVWKDPINRVPADAVTEWRLKSEPFLFVVDRNGVITDKFEGPVSLAELDEAMRKVTS
jgi:hypothetical protein